MGLCSKGMKILISQFPSPCRRTLWDPGTWLFPPKGISWPCLEAKSRHLLHAIVSFPLSCWDGIRAKICSTKGWFWSCGVEIWCKMDLHNTEPCIHPGNGSVPLCYLRISGKVCERSLPTPFIDLFSSFPFVVESKEEVKDSLSEVIRGIK